MFITITGELGSGKTTVAKILSQKYGFTIYSTGSIQREIAKEKGITTLELNQQMSNDIYNIYDKLIDDKTIELAQSHERENIVFDSRMAWHFVERSFKVYVTVDAYVAANRVIVADRGEEEHYYSIEEAIKSLIKRKQLEDSRFSEIYSVETTNWDNYDLVVDSTSIKADELASFIYKKANNRKRKQEMYIDPKRLFPTQVIRDINPNYVDELRYNNDNCPVEVVEYDGIYFIINGHHKVCSTIQNLKNLVSVSILEVDDNGCVKKYNKRVEEIIGISRKTYYDWEDFNTMKFFGYPDMKKN